MPRSVFRLPGGSEIVVGPGHTGTRVCLQMARKIPAPEVRVANPDTVGDAGYSSHYGDVNKANLAEEADLAIPSQPGS